MNKKNIILLALVLVLIFFLVYTPHFTYRFPKHIDEWHHITEAFKMKKGEYTGGVAGFRAGFHVVLVGLSYMFNLVLTYKFFPAIWAVITALVLFYITYKKTKDFYVALFSALFFGFIRSNVNIGGLWFFTPLTFSIPFIFLYMYFFSDGIENQKKSSLIISLVIMAFLIPIHAISVLFAFPILLIYCILNLNSAMRQWRVFMLFFIIPVIGFIFFKFIFHLSFNEVIPSILNGLVFRKGWGVLELNNSFFELYSLLGYIFAFIGIVSIVLFQKKWRKYLIYIIWPLWMLVMIFFYRITGISFLSPYQRNLYYFVISIPFLAALGLKYSIEFLKLFIGKLKYRYVSLLKKVVVTMFVILSIIFVLGHYFNLQNNVALYRLIDDNGYNTLIYLADLPSGKVMAPSEMGSTVYAISGKNPVASVLFYGNRTKVTNFYSSDNCSERNQIIKKIKVKYVLSDSIIDCGWDRLYAEGIYLYGVRWNQK